MSVEVERVKTRLEIQAGKIDEALKFYKTVFGATEIEYVNDKRYELLFPMEEVIQLHAIKRPLHERLVGEKQSKRGKHDEACNSSNPIPLYGLSVTFCMNEKQAVEIIKRASASGKVTHSYCSRDSRSALPLNKRDFIGCFTDSFGFKWEFYVPALEARKD